MVSRSAVPIGTPKLTATKSRARWNSPSGWDWASCVRHAR